MDRRSALILILLASVVPGCRSGQPLLVSAGGDKTTPGTIGGVVSAVGGDRLAGRTVTAVQEGTGQRYSGVTGTTGGFSIEVPPGDYHLLVDVQPGEKVVKEPGTFHINKSDLDPHRDIVIGS